MRVSLTGTCFFHINLLIPNMKFNRITQWNYVKHVINSTLRITITYNSLFKFRSYINDINIYSLNDNNYMFLLNLIQVIFFKIYC